MHWNRVKTLFMVICLFLMAPIASAAPVTLDAVENAGWWEESLEQSYLKIVNSAGTVVWSNTSNGLAWGSFSGLVADLSDGWIGDSGVGIDLGGTYDIQSGGNVFLASSSPIYQTVSLAKGKYVITLADGSAAYNIKGYNDGNYPGADVWNTYVQMWTATGGLAFGDGMKVYASADLALDAGKTLNVALDLSEATDLYLYINDINALDNIGSVTLDIRAVPVPAAWLLLGSGIAALVAGRRHHGKRSV